jgi:flagellar P-ring protein precursor FlgI
MNWKRILPAITALALAAGCLVQAAPSVRVKELATIQGVRSNPLFGYGLVVGLKGTGDGTQAEFTTQSLANLLRRSGVSVPQSAIRVRNVAAVMVTADLPPFTRAGQRLDVQVSSIGDAKSLQGGTLLIAPLQGPDGATYAVAQGAVSIGGAFLGGGGGNSVTKNHPTTGRIPGGAIVEREVAGAFGDAGEFRLLLNQPDFATASRIVGAVNSSFGSAVARAEDAVSIVIDPPAEFASSGVSLLARIQEIEVEPDASARIVINEKTGTVVMGNDVRISTVALAHGNLTVEVGTYYETSQPMPFSENGETVVVPQTELYAEEGANSVITLKEGATVSEIVESLNDLGVSARDMIAILQAIRSAGALHAEIVAL